MVDQVLFRVDPHGENLRKIWMIFLSIFCAGVVSLLLELSLLREFVYIFGSTAVSNALIISTFLVGLAVGAYLGTWGKFDVSDEADGRRKFALIQLLSILFVVTFFLSKKYFIYDCNDANLVRLYFLFSVFTPSFLSGLGYAISVKIMHWRGEKFVTYIYAFSTVGSVIGGLTHGIILVPLWGMQSTYLCAVIFAALALCLMYPLRNLAAKTSLALLISGAVALIHFNISEVLFPSQDILFSKDSQFGIVEVWRLKHEKAVALNSRIGGREADLEANGPPIDLKVNNVHQSYNFPVDRNIHKQWAETTLGIVAGPAKVLLFGYGSGVTAASYLASPQVTRIDIVENCMPVIDAAKIFFPQEFSFLEKDNRARLVIDDFRGHVRFTKEKYDIVALDHTIRDPYYIGFFTLEFFGQLKKTLNPGGIVLLLGDGISWNTTRISFRYVYRNVNPEVEPFLRKRCLFLTDRKLAGPAANDYELIEDEAAPGGLIYSDEMVRRFF